MITDDVRSLVPRASSAVAAADAFRQQVGENFFAYDEIRSLSSSDQDLLVRLLLQLREGDATALQDLQTLVYEEIPVGMEEFVLGRRYLGLKDRISDAKLQILMEFSHPSVRKAWIAAGSGGGKALTLDTPIPTVTGWTTMGEVAVGDLVLDEAYAPCRVVAKSAVESRDTFTLCFDDDSVIRAADTHEWPTTEGLLTTAALHARGAPVSLIPTVERRQRRVLSVVPLLSQPVQCIQVDSPSHVYLAGTTYVPTHNSFMASIVQAWMIYQVLCLKRPDVYYMLGPGSKIATVNLSTAKEQAKDVVFAEFVGRLSQSPWFAGRYEALQGRCVFPEKGVYALSGGSSASSYFGYHTIMGTLDEASYMIDRQDRSLAEDLTEALTKSLSTRFPNAYKLMVISTLRSDDDYLYRNIERVAQDGRVLVNTTDPYRPY